MQRALTVPAAASCGTGHGSCCLEKYAAILCHPFYELEKDTEGRAYAYTLFGIPTCENHARNNPVLSKVALCLKSLSCLSTEHVHEMQPSAITPSFISQLNQSQHPATARQRGRIQSALLSNERA